jgi:hypothetical protein
MILILLNIVSMQFLFLTPHWQGKNLGRRKGGERCCLAFFNIENNDRNQISTVEH